MIPILFLAADPTNASRLRLGEEFREIQEKLKLAKLRDNFKLELPQLSIRPPDIAQALLDTQPQIVHFSGHGASTGALCFENQTGQVQLVQPDALAALFEQFSSQINCVLLNACYSETQAKAIAEHIEYVIGMNQAIGDKAAIAFAIGFYQALGAGRPIEDAYKLGCVQIRLQSIPEHLTPVLIQKEQVQP
ncbi:MAG: CHAT domain-containing protein [Anaerolineae bacterium]|nr:CHAT domain-containing protein [Anaerolineae bacterium]